MEIASKYDSLTPDKKAKVTELLHKLQLIDSRENLFSFTKNTFKKFQPKPFNTNFYDILDKFAHRKIKNLIISMPPQHGKSEGSSRRLPAYIAGIRPDEQIALVSYAATKAQKFGREIMGIMREPEYREIFPDVQYPDRGYPGAKANTNMNRESINSDGWMKFVGVGGPLTGDPVDILILDDLYKGWKDANSPVTQQSVWDWYISVADSRLHNDSQQLITFTRWSENDIIAKLIDSGYVVIYNGTDDIDEVIDSLDDRFLYINFQALKEGTATDFDPRKEGEALWPEKQSKKKLESSRSKDPNKFDCLYQGNPQNKDGLLYQKDFKTYSKLPKLKKKKNYTDTADTGEDYLCSIVYGVPLSDVDIHKYVIDVLYTTESMEVTEELTAMQLDQHKVNESWFESNNGGRGFARNVQKLVKSGVIIDWFHQGDNKEARIYSESGSVNNQIIFPDDWHVRWPTFYKHVTKFKKLFKANDFDDAPDVLTGIIELEANDKVSHVPKVDARNLNLH